MEASMFDTSDASISFFSILIRYRYDIDKYRDIDVSIDI